MNKLIKSLAIAALLASTALAAAAEQLTIGLASEQSSIDPQFSRTGNNQNVSQMMFERLVRFDSNLQMSPALAESWESLDPLTWQVKLRPGVTFQDGSPFTADDVIFSLDRAPDVPIRLRPIRTWWSALHRLKSWTT